MDERHLTIAGSSWLVRVNLSHENDGQSGSTAREPKAVKPPLESRAVARHERWPDVVV
jgi:hypothetical protein